MCDEGKSDRSTMYAIRSPLAEVRMTYFGLIDKDCSIVAPYVPCELANYLTDPTH